MPTYDYQCRSCGSVTEVIHSMMDDGPTTCEACGGTLRRMLYPTGIIFKGSGFYRTDSRSTSGSTPSSTSSASTDAKPDAAKTSKTPAPETGSGTAPASSESSRD